MGECFSVIKPVVCSWCGDALENQAAMLHTSQAIARSPRSSATELHGWVAGFSSLETLHLAPGKVHADLTSLRGPCNPQAIESFALCVGQWGWVRRDALPQRTDVLLFSAATAAICHCYSDGGGRHRDVFRSKYLNVLDFILGNTGAPSQACCRVAACCPSRRDPD